MLELPSLAHYFSPDHEQFRSALRGFVFREIIPFVNEWDEAGTFPKHLYRGAADPGATGLGYPEEYGGSHFNSERPCHAMSFNDGRRATAAL